MNYFLFLIKKGNGLLWTENSFCSFSWTRAIIYVRRLRHNSGVGGDDALRVAWWTREERER